MWVAWGRILLTTYITPRPKKNYGSNINHHLCIGSSSGCQKKCQPSSITLGLQVQEFEKNRWFFAQKPTNSANRPISFNVFFLHHLIKLPPSPPQKKLVKHTFRKNQGTGWIPNEPVLYQCPGNSFQIFQLRHRAWPFFYTPPVFWRRFICDKFEPTKCCSSLLGTLNNNINADSMQFLVRKKRSYVHSRENKHVITFFTLK